MTTGLIDDISTAPKAAASITPRRSLPSGRAVVGALLVTIAAVGSFVIATGGNSTPETSFLVATRSIDAGEQVTAGDFELVPIDLPVEMTSTAITGIGGLDGATALGDLHPGELVTTRDLLAAAEVSDGANITTHELTLPVPRDRAGQSLVPGDRVTVLATLPTADSPRTVVAVEDALVVDWLTGGDGIGASGTGVLTLALDTPETVIAVAHLASDSQLTVVRTTRAMTDIYPAAFPPIVSPSSGADPVTGDEAQ